MNWIARNKDGKLNIFRTEPRKLRKDGMFAVGTPYYGEGPIVVAIDRTLFPEVKYENSPLAIELKTIEDVYGEL